MTLDELYNLLHNAIHNERIELNSSLRQELEVILEALDITPSLIINKPVLSQSITAVTLKGTATYRGSGCSATLVGTVAGLGYAFTLTLVVNTPESWTFRTAFDNLPDTYISQGLVLEPVESYLDTTQVIQPAFTASSPPLTMTHPNITEDSPPPAGFTGFLVMDGYLSNYKNFLGSGPFPLKGNILIKNQTFPLFNIRVDIAGKSINLGASSMGQIGLRLSTVSENDTETTTIDSSILELLGSITIGQSNPVNIEVSAQLLQGDIRWVFHGEFSDYTEVLSEGLQQLAVFLDMPLVDLAAPLAIKALNAFYIKDVKLSLIPPDTSSGQLLPTVDYLSGTIMTKDSWLPSIPFIKLSKVGVRWLVNRYESGPVVNGCVFGNVTFGNPPYDTTFFVNAYIPDFIIQCSLKSDEEFDLGRVFGWFYGGSGPSTGLKVTDLKFIADPRSQVFKFQANISTDYSITFGNLTFSFDELDIWVYSLQNKLTGGITGTMLIEGKEPDQGITESFEQTGFWLAANYTESGAWLFEGGLIPGTTLELVNLIAQFLGLDTPPQGLSLTITIEDLVTSFDTESGTYTLAGTVVGRLKLDNILGGLDLSLKASVDIERRPRTLPGDFALETDTGDMILVGSLFGQFMVNKFLVGAGINLKEKESTYIFTIGYDNLVLTGTTSWTGDEQNRHPVINFTLQGITLGSIIEFFVNLARPGSDYRLEPPWDFLNGIDLAKFTLTVDPRDSWVSLTYAVNLNLLFIAIETVGLKYAKVEGRDSVRLVLTGRFLEEEYREGNELNWDVVDDPPPAVPGKGEQLLRLRYLGIGQHIALRNTGGFNSVSEVINALRDQLKPVEDTSRNPLDQSSGSLLSFSENSHWLAGLDLTVMEMLSLAAVFHDPDIYGLVVSLAGPKAGSLAGFRFEVLYKRISGDIGVFKAVFRMPEAFRQLQFGIVSITLGVVSVEIYTNGDFKVDLGFPKNRDFTDSFCLQAYIFIGHGGIYFAKLSGPTSSRVPAVTNGSFNPVLELGVGLAVGVGREFSKGPLKAGLYVELLAIFEGVFAWFHPNDAAQQTEMYYWARAVAGITGKLYGCVDFAIIKVSISVEAYATVTLVLESYEPTPVDLDVGVEVKAAIQILFIKINFSFGLTLHESFIIGEKGTPPWITAGSGEVRPSLRMMSNAYRPRRRSHFETRALTYLENRLGNRRKVMGHTAFRTDKLLQDDYTLVWNPGPVFPDAKTRNISLKLVPAFTINNIGVQWDGGGANPGTPDYKILFLMTADNGTGAEAVEHHQIRKVTVSNTLAAANPPEIALNLLIEAMFRWCISAKQMGQQDDVTSGQLEDLYHQLNMPQTAGNGFNFDILSDFFDNNLVFTIGGIPDGGEAAAIGGTLFPMIPTLQWSSGELGSMDYDQFRPMGPTYEQGADEYFKKMVVNPPSRPSSLAAAGNDEPAISMAQSIFCDYFLMIARTVVQSALDLFTRYRYLPAPGDSLAGIASDPKFKKVQVDYAVKTVDTAGSLALVFGIPTAELRYLNPDIDSHLETAQPGATISVNLGITPQSIAIANQNVELSGDLRLEIGTVPYQLGSGETLKGIADRFNMAGVMDLFNPPPQGVTGMSQDPLLLKTGGVMSIVHYTYPNPAGLSVDLTAAIFFTRLRGSSSIIYQPWYSENIFSLNRDIIKAYNGALPAGLELAVPAALYDIGHTIRYITLAGDTMEWIGAYFSLLQNFNAGKDPGGEFGEFNKTIRTLNPGGSGPVTMPAVMQHGIEPLETLDSLWRKFFLDNLQALVDMVQEQQGLLAPLALANIPGVVYQTQSGDTLAKAGTALNIPVEELAGSAGVFTVKDLFKYSAENPVSLEIRDIPKLNISDILTVIQNSEIHSRVSGMLSRFFLHGLRLPAPEQAPGGPATATGPMTSLYELTGQQVNGINPDPTLNPEDLRATVNFTEKIPKKWVAFYNSYVIGGADTVAALEAKYPRLGSLNPAIRREGRFRPGLILLTDQIPKEDDTGLQVKIKEKHLREGYPAGTLNLDIVKPLSAMKLSETTPKSYGFQQHILWQTPVPVPLPGRDSNARLAGSPSIWIFPPDLTSKVQATERPAHPYRLQYHQGALPDTPVEFEQYAWATLLKINLRKVRQAENGGNSLADTYEITGADPAGRFLLYQLIQALPVLDNPEDKIFLLYDPNAASTLPTGLSGDDPHIENTCLIKTNLTTETAGGPLNRRPVTDDAALFQGEYFAALKCHRQFLLLLWECSVVGGGGFYLHYAGETGKGLPDSIFAADGNGSLWLVNLLASQSSGSSPDRNLYPFNNCAVVGINLDTASANLYAEVADSSEFVKLPTVQPGNVGFDLTLKNPEISLPTAPGQLTAQRLYSLLGYKIGGQDSGFITSPEAAPVSPTESGDPGAPLSVRTACRRARLRGARDEQPTENWQLHQVIPVSRFAEDHGLPDCPPLPTPLNDPYTGITPGAKVPVAVWFTDVFGNVSTGCENSVDCTQTADGRLCLPVGYMDEVIGLGKWPGAVSTYQMSACPDGPGAFLTIRTAFQPSSFMPGMSQSLENAQRIIEKQLQRYTRIYYQMEQKNVTFAIRTSLSQAPGQEPDTLAFNGAPLRSFTAAACIWLSGIASLVQGFADTTAANTLDKISTHYGVSYAELAAGNLSGQVSELFSASALSTPRYIIAGQGDSAKSLFDRLSLKGIRTNPADLLLETENIILPLKPGTALSIPRYSVALSDPAVSLEDIAALYQCTAGGFAAANTSLQGLLIMGAELSYQGLTLAVQSSSAGGPSQSFNDMAQRFIIEKGADSRTAGIDVAMANRNVKGIFQTGATVTIADYTTGDGDTLLSNGSGASKEALAALNTDTPNIYEAGTPVYYGATDYPAEGTVDEFCKIYNLTPEQLFYHNRNRELSTPYFRIPGAVRLPSEKTAVSIPYPANAQDSLETIANKFDIPEDSTDARMLRLARANSNIPGLFTPEKIITVDQVAVETGTEESFSSLLRKFKEQGHEIQLSQLVASTGKTTGLFDPAAFFICPPALLSHGVEPFSLEALSKAYGIPVLPLAAANCALLDIIAGGVELSVTVTSAAGGQQTRTTYSVIATANDTLNSIVSRFNDQTPTSLEDVVLANETVNLIKPGANILLPPNTVEIPVKIGAGGPQYPAAVFPVTVALEIKRSAELIHPDFDSDGPVHYDRSLIPPYTARNGTENSSMRLRGFAEQFQAAIPSLWLATCKPSSVLEGGASSPNQELWAVFFGEGGISKVTVKRGVNYPDGSDNYFPRFFALRPLYNKLASQQGVAIRPLNDDGTLGEAAPADYQGIDLEVWARKFLDDVELFLSAAYSAPVWQLNGGEQRASLESIISAKKTLCEAISLGVDYVLDTSTPVPQQDNNPDPARESARKQLEQQLRVNLSHAYATDVILQFDAEVLSQGLSKPARLSGQAKTAGIKENGNNHRDPSAINTNFSITNAKTPLDLSCSYVNFLLKANNAQLQQSIILDLKYIFNELEFNIQKAKDIEGYEASNWLSFILPIGEDHLPDGFDIDLGRPVIPLPLRIYPENPRLISQLALPGKNSPASIAEAELWNYLFSYEHQDAGQDQLKLTVRVNEAAAALRRLYGAGSEPTLLETLAQYMNIAEKLWNILSRLTVQPESSTDEILGKSIVTFASLAGSVARSWKAHWTNNPVPLWGTPAGSTNTYDYTVKLNPDTSNIYYSTLTLGYNTGNPWPGKSAPAITCIPDNAAEIPLTAGNPSGNTCIYTFPADAGRLVPVFTRLKFRLEFKELNIIDHQNALSLVSVSRNNDIFKQNVSIPTNPAFVFQTPQIGFPNVTTPLLSWDIRFPFGASGSLAGAIKDLLEGILGSSAGDKELAISVQYGYTLVQEPGREKPIIMSLPVLFKPRFNYTESVSQELANALVHWKQVNDPNTQDGFWNLSVNVFSTIPGAPQLPVLEFKHLTTGIREEGSHLT
jgi:hypothetical protein